MAKGRRRRSRRTVLGAGLRAERQELVEVSGLTPAEVEQRAADQRADEQRQRSLRRARRLR
jgi:hypothetical protein